VSGAEHRFVGFGFGPIQGGLFAKEASESGNFARIVVAEIDQRLVDAVRANKGSYYVNVAGADGIETLKIEGVELVNPTAAIDKRLLAEALRQASEIATCLPSVAFYESGGANSVASLIAEGLRDNTAEAKIVYAAENDNRAAEILEQVATRVSAGAAGGGAQFLNTVIGKMSRVVTEPGEIAELGLATIAPGIKRAFLVERFNRILVSRTEIAGFRPGIEVFIEKDNLLPFEEAKLYGHNAIHSLLRFIGALKGYTRMTEVRDDAAVMEIGRGAFLDESGGALIRKHSRLGEELFTEDGYERYVEDLLERMTNPYLADSVVRVCRDVVRKLGQDGRIFGTMSLAIEYGIEPRNMGLGAIAGIAVLLDKAGEYGLPDDLRCRDQRELDYAKVEGILRWIWRGRRGKYTERLVQCVQSAREQLEAIVYP